MSIVLINQLIASRGLNENLTLTASLDNDDKHVASVANIGTKKKDPVVDCLVTNGHESRVEAYRELLGKLERAVGEWVGE